MGDGEKEDVDRGEATEAMASPLAARTSQTDPRRRWMVLIKPTPRGLAIDRFIIGLTGYSLISLGLALADRRPYLRHYLVVTTIGAKTGAQRPQGLAYFRYGDKLVICGSYGGGRNNPLWVDNIAADPHCWIRLRRRFIPTLARIAQGDERAKVFAEVSKQHPTLERFQSSAEKYGRDVPLVLLEPQGPLPSKA
jgi:deazaflavin-dependent oxidoreductase (nitroreductase family)